MLFTTEEIVPTSCDTMTMAMRRFNSWRMRYSSFSNWLSTKLAGSSRISSRGSEMIARHRSARCICPPDISPMARPATSAMPVRSSSCSARRQSSAV